MRFGRSYSRDWLKASEKGKEFWCFILICIIIYIIYLSKRKPNLRKENQDSFLYNKLHYMKISIKSLENKD